MPLHFELLVNNNVIGSFRATNLTGHVPVNRQCAYEVEVEQNNRVARTIVTHNYDEGPFSLVAKALSAVDYQELVSC